MQQPVRAESVCNCWTNTASLQHVEAGCVYSRIKWQFGHVVSPGALDLPACSRKESTVSFTGPDFPMNACSQRSIRGWISEAAHIDTPLSDSHTSVGFLFNYVSPLMSNSPHILQTWSLQDQRPPFFIDQSQHERESCTQGTRGRYGPHPTWALLLCIAHPRSSFRFCAASGNHIYEFCNESQRHISC